MKILIDIAHPAHIHYFRNFSKIMEQRGHECLFTLRDKGIIVKLAKCYKINYIIRSRESKSKIKYMLRAIYNVYIIAKEFKPDIFIDFGTVVSSPISRLFGKPYIAFDDTESAFRSRNLHMPFTDVILTPECFELELNKKKHLKFNGLMELFYLHPKYYKPRAKVMEKLGVKQGEKYVIMRFVSWEAHHDKGLEGLTMKNKIKAIDELSECAKVFISSEKKLPVNLQKYAFDLPVDMMHDAMAYSSLLYGESSTMASEAAALGVPSIFIDQNGRGYTSYLERKYGLVHNFIATEKDQQRSLSKALDIIQGNNSNFKNKGIELVNDSLDMNAFLVWFIENYPKSKQIMRDNPDYQYKFK